MTLTRKLLHVGATALMLSTVATVTTFVSADAAYAERGSNGNGNGNGRANRSDRDTNRGQERQATRQQIMEAAGASNWGAIASELGELNKANANPNARMNSSDPIHQALAVYENSGGISVAGIAAYNAALSDYQAAFETIGDPVLDEFNQPVLDEFGEPVLITAEDIGTQEEYLAANLSAELISAYESFAVINATRDEPLTSGALAALNYMLNLDAPLSE